MDWKREARQRPVIRFRDTIRARIDSTMAKRHAASHDEDTEHEIREQEVLRARKELEAYFKGRRTEREARAALKTIKGFIRYRERLAPGKRRPLPGAPSLSPKPQNTTGVE